MTDISGERPAALRLWFLAARPRTLGAAAAPVIMGTALAAAAGGAHVLSALAALLGAMLIQIGANFANDYFDFVKGADTAARLGPTRATQAGWVTPVQMRNATALVLFAAFLVGLYLVWRGGWPILLIGALSLLFAVLYTGGPYPLGYLGLGDIFVFVFFGPVAVAGTFYVQRLEWSWLPVWAGVAPGLFSMAILAVNNLRDVDEDRRTGKRTLAVRLGPGFARFEHAACIVTGAVLVPLLLCMAVPGHWAAMVSAMVLLPASRAIRAVHRQSGAPLNAQLGATGKLLLLHSLLFSAGWLW